MKFKFNTTIVVHVGGEVELQSDACHVFTKEQLTIMPTFMVSEADLFEGLDEDEKRTLFQIITNNVLKRAVQQTHIPEVTVGVPVDMGKPPTGEPN